jgi:hypothetical protein
LQGRAHAARALLGTVAIAVSGEAESSGEGGGEGARGERACWDPPRAVPSRGERASAWRPAATALVGAGYAAALGWTSWNSAMDGDDGGTAVLAAVLSVLAWTAATVLFGYLLHTWAFAVIPLAVVIPAWIGDRAEEFDNELRYFNWLLLIVVNAALASIGVWLAHRRSRRTSSARSAGSA